MDTIDVLVLHGSPGAGKTTLARAASEILREAGLAHGVIDLDEISLVHPDPGRSFARENLRLLWPRYAAVPGLRLLLPTVLADAEELELLRDALPGARLAVCELTAPEAVLKERVTVREPNEFWREGLRRWVDVFHARTDLDRIRDFRVSTHGRSEEAAAREVLEKAGWLAARPEPAPPAPDFVPGLDLARTFFEEAVRPLLAAAFPGLRYAAARLGPGSEVLGFDTARSTDHDWGPRLELFLTPEDAQRHGAEIHDLLARQLPKQVLGYPTHFRRGADPHDPVRHMEPTEGPVDHRVTVQHVDAWLAAVLGRGAADPTAADWLAFPQQKLAEVTAGAVFRDDLGLLTAARERLAWYPDQVWRYLLASQWQRIAEEEAFVGRCAEVGDELGSAVVAGRVVRHLMRLCLLMERQYAPYGKWLGSAFARTGAAGPLTPSLRAALSATGHPERERHLCDAYETVARRHNATGLTPPVDPTRRPYHGRPFLVLHADRFARALHATVTDPVLRDLPLIGAQPANEPVPTGD